MRSLYALSASGSRLSIFCFRLSAFCFLLFFAACANKQNEVAVTAHSFEDEIDPQQNLVFTFNKELYPDSMLNQWDSTQYISFKPAVAGRFKWNYGSELLFSPATSFQPGTAYTATLTDKLLRHTSKNYQLSKDNTFHFHTPYLQVTNTNISWTRGKTFSNIMVQADVNFNYEINTADAGKFINIISNGNKINFTIVSSGNGKIVSVQFNPLNDSDQETPINIIVKKGIKVSNSHYVCATDTTFKAMIPSRFNLSITNVIAQHNGTEGVVTVYTSQPLEENNLKDLISFDPKINFDLQVNDQGFVITSKEFDIKTNYQLAISSRVEGTLGGKLKVPFTQQITFGKLRPAITFVNNKGIYLSAQGYRNVALNLVNVPKVKVVVTKVYANNIEQFFRQGKEYDYGYNPNSNDDDDNNGGSYQYYNTGNIGDTVFQKEYDSKTLPQLNAARVLHLDFEDKIKDFKGIYVLTVSSSDYYWIQQSKIIAISDIGLIVKQEKNAVYVFANSFKTTDPLAGINVSFISSNNQKLYSAVTDKNGVAVFDNIETKAPNFKVAMVTAQQNADFNFVLFSNAAIETSRFDVGGSRNNDANLTAMLYGDRNLYRPGETINVSAIIRNDHWRSPGEIPVKLKLRMPDGKEYTTIRKILNEQGSCETSIKLPESAMTGTYTLEAYTGNDVLLNTYDISIEEFVPDRIKADIKIDKTNYYVGDSIHATANAQNLFGTPAVDRNYQYELNLQQQAFAPKQYPDYNFTTVKAFNFNPILQEGKTDEHGNSHQDFFLSSDLKDEGILSGNILFTVFDETGRPVHRVQNFSVYTQYVFYGIKNFDEYVSTRSPLAVPLIAVDKQGALLKNVKANITVVKKEWQTVIENNGNGYRYISQESDKPVLHQTMNISGTSAIFYYTPLLSGEYEIRVSRPGTDSYVAQSFYAWGWGDTQFTSFEVNNEGNVDITTDKAKYNIGDHVKILFTTPFDGKLLVTIERDHLLKYYYLNTQKKAASLDLKADENFVPDVYITATLIRPMDDNNMPLTVAHGFKPLFVENTATHLPVTITAVDHSRSKTKQVISVKTAPGAYITVAAVDEGILQVKGYASPNPHQFFYQKQALQVNSYDVYPFLLPEIEGKSSSGGDEVSKNLQMRVNPNFVNRVQLVAFWSGIEKADGNGNVKFPIDIPQFSGDIRVMAVAYKGNAFGSSDKHIKVADPVVISTALPRFLSPKDTVIVPVTLSNTTNENTTASVNMQFTGPLASNSSSQNISLKANSENRAVFKIFAQNKTGAGSVTVGVNALHETFTDKTEISIRPPASLQKETGSGDVNAGNTTDISVGGNFIPATINGKLVVSKSPAIQFAKNLDELIQYPYGCVEQTVSSAFPQLYYDDLVKSIYGTTNKNMNPNYNVQQAINKLQSMQMSNGALSFWPGGGYESWWGSIYAAHFLWEAKKAGFQINDKTLDRLFDYMKYRLQKRETFVYYYNENLSKEIAPEEVAYSLFVLALAGQPQLSTMDYYKANPELLSLDSRYLIATAFYLAGQKEKYIQMLPIAFSGEIPNSATGGSFYSYIRDEAISLYALLQVDPNNSQVGIMAKHLAEQIKNEHYLSTQENAFSFLALGEIAHRANQTTASATVRLNGKTIVSTSGKNITIDIKNIKQNKWNIQVNGAGSYYYYWEVSGISADGSYKQEDSYMRVRRTFYDRNGNEISGRTFHQNDLIVVKISLTGEYNSQIDNVVITDMLPAGLEIENPRISSLPQLKWIKDDTEPDYIDYRDDRINLFTSANGHTKNFYYVLRAVSPGTYQLGPVQADAMYNGEYHSYNGAGVVKVVE